MKRGRFGRFYATAVGKKVIVATTGAIMLGFLVAHSAGSRAKRLKEKLPMHRSRGARQICLALVLIAVPKKFKFS